MGKAKSDRVAFALADYPATDVLLEGLTAPRPGARRVVVCHPVEAEYVAACVEERFGTVDRVTHATVDGKAGPVHSDGSAATSVHETARMPAGRACTWTTGTVSPADFARWSEAGHGAAEPAQAVQGDLLAAV